MRTLRRILLTCAALAGGGLGLSACTAGVGNDAAQVGGYSISRAQLTDVLKAVHDNAGFRCVITGGQADTTAGAGGSGSYSSAFSAQILTTLVESRALQLEAARRHLAVDAFARSLGASQLQQVLAPGQSSDQSCTTPASLILAELPDAVRRHFVDLQAAQDVLAASSVGVRLSPSGVAKWARSNPDQATVSCLSVAVFPTSGAASGFQRAVAAGGSFSGLATSAGAQPQSGCVPADSLPPPLPGAIDSLSPGQLSAPVSYDGGFLVIQLSSRRLATGTEAAGLLMNSTASRVSAIVASALAKVHVRVDPAFGSWRKVSSTFQVVPPDAPPAGLLLNPSAVEPAGAASAG